MFKKNNYKIVKNAVSKELSNFLFNYLKVKTRAVFKMFELGYYQEGFTDMGTIGDEQAPGPNYSCYSDFAMEALLLKLKDTVEKQTKLELIENYTYCRLYVKGVELKRHKDRSSCEISTTLNLGGDPWPIYIEPSGQLNKKGKKVILNPGDMLIYNGIKCEHWREPFEGNLCGQVFLHYTPLNKENLNNKYDGRPFLGLPSSFKC